MNSKRGATNTIVIGAVIAALVLALVVVGVFREGNIPLKDKIENAFNEVLIFLNIRNSPPSSYDCKPRSLELIPEGNILVNNLGFSEEQKNNLEFRYCEGECQLKNTGFGDYRIGAIGDFKGVNFDRYATTFWELVPLEEDEILRNEEGGILDGVEARVKARNSWTDYNNYLKEDNIEDAELYHNLYHGFIESMGQDMQKLNEFYDISYTRAFKFTARPSGIFEKNSLKIAEWKYGEWIVSQGSEKYKGKSTGQALNVFYEMISTGIADNVFYMEFSTRPDSSSVSAIGFLGDDLDRLKITDGDNEVDSEEELTKLNNFANKKIEEFTLKSTITQENESQIQKILDGKHFEYRGVVYSFELEKEKNARIINIIGENKKYILFFKPDNMGSRRWVGWTEQQNNAPEIVPREGWLYLDGSPFVLVEVVGSGIKEVKYEEDYKLKRNDFEHFKKVKIIRDYFLRICKGGIGTTLSL